MHPSGVHAMYDVLLRLYRLWGDTELPKRPKLHQRMHLVDRAPHQGNPSHYATWEDESLNKVLGNLGRQAHRSVWEARILVYFEAGEGQRIGSGRKRRF